MLIVQLSLYPTLRLGATAQHPAAMILLPGPFQVLAHLLYRHPAIRPSTDTRPVRSGGPLSCP